MHLNSADVDHYIIVTHFQLDCGVEEWEEKKSRIHFS